jgi:DNA helicase HerA-like ATPase
VTSPRQIGRVAGVDSEKIQVELDPQAAGFVKAGPHGVAPVGLINSYIVIPAGYQKIIGVVTAIRMAPQPSKRDDDVFADASVERILEAVMVGRIEGDQYRAGLATYPALFAPVLIGSEHDVELVFRPPAMATTVSIGEAVASPGQEVRLDVNALLSRHSAIVGTTGAGKSCTVTALIDGLLGLDMPSMNVVIFDSNGEYAGAFESATERGKKANALVIGPAKDARAPLLVPHWFMNNAEHLELANAGEGAQAPLLQRAVVDARLASDESADQLRTLRVVARAIEDIRAASRAGRKPQEVVKGLLTGLDSALAKLADEAEASGDESSQKRWISARDAVKDADKWQLATGNDAWDKPLTLNQGLQLTQALEAIESVLEHAIDELGLGSATALADFDAPRYYSFEDLLRKHLPARIDLESATEPRIRNYAATMLMRLSSLLADSRYDFLTRVPRYDDRLARFLRLLLGWHPMEGIEDRSKLPWGHAASGNGRHSVTILDLSEVASDVLGTVTGLLGRLLLEFAQRIEPRGSFPILLVLEEAHRYIPRTSVRPLQSSAAFERVAREGRKFGVSLMVSSQRPSELSPAVLAQCGTLIAHRMVNSEDQTLVRESAPVAGREVLRQLPGLATQHAVVLGQAVPAPSYVRVRTISAPPRSTDPNYVGLWREPAEKAGGERIDEIARRWEESAKAAPSKPLDEAPASTPADNLQADDFDDPGPPEEPEYFLDDEIDDGEDNAGTPDDR